MRTFQKLKSITKSTIDYSYDFEVEKTHRIIARLPESKNAFYTSNCWHPDIIEFITAKQQQGRLTKFNMSVNCTNEFMEKVIGIENSNNEAEIVELDKWDLIFPDTLHERYKEEWDGNIKKWQNKGYPVKIYNTISVKGLWNLIMESTYNRAEPGILFLDRANEYNPLYYGEYIAATNPCLRGDVKVSTPDGDISIIELVQNFEQGQEQFVYTMNTNTNSIEPEKITNALLTSHNREILELSFNDGKILHVTPDHKIFTKNRGFVEAQHLDENDDIVTNF